MMNLRKDYVITHEDLMNMQAWPLSRKIQVSQTRILEYAAHYDNKVYVSFSGGIDSTVLRDLAIRVIPNITCVYIDTGLEYPKLRKFALSQDNITVIKPKMTFKEVIQKYGYPVISKEQASYIQEYRDSKSEKLKNIRLNGDAKGRFKIAKKHQYLIKAPFKISDKCCDVMKKAPAHRYEKESGNHPIIGTMAEESILRTSNWYKNGCNAFNLKRSISTPLAFWTKQDILQYIRQFNIPYCSDIYGDIIEVVTDRQTELSTTGLHQTGCAFCMFGCHLENPNKFQILYKIDPYLWNYCMKPIEEGGLGEQQVLDYINAKSKPENIEGMNEQYKDN
jgi:3'-phosphoadenosine 5'-phosphosulfate sulfotransferase (PAPS reductase)/FAD synthetase